MARYRVSPEITYGMFMGGGASWNAVPRTYWISLTDLGTWIGGKGYTG